MAGNPFSITPANYNVQPLLTGIGTVMKENQAKKQKQIETQEITDAMSINNPNLVADLMIKYPDRQKEIVEGANYKKGVTDKVMIDAYRKASVDPANGAQYMQEAVDRVLELGGRPDNLRQSVQMFNENPEQAAQLSKTAFASLDPKGYKALQKERGVSDSTAPSSVREWEYFNSLSKQDQKQFKNLKRQGYTIGDIAGVQNIIPLQPGEKPTPLSTIENEIDAKSKISGAIESGKLNKQLKFKPMIEAAISLARKEATDKGETLTDLNRAKAALPGLTEVVTELKELAKVATSTFGGRVFDAAVKETGFGATKGGTARAKFIAIVNNQVLPLLKQTFGGSFSVQEGQELKASMGDPDATPEEKLAQLDAFIAQKTRDIEAKELELSAQGEVTTSVQEGATATNPQTGQKVIFTNGKWQPAS